MQILGKTELAFFETLSPERTYGTYENACASDETPCICISRGLDVPIELMQTADEAKIPFCEVRDDDDARQPHYRISWKRACADDDDSWCAR